MLKKLRSKKTAKKIFIILAIVIIPAFAFWGFSSVLRTSGESAYAGNIFGRKVSLLEYRDALDAVKNRAIMQFGDNFSEIKKYLDLELLAWNRLILLYEAKKRKIKVNDQEIIALIENYPFFQRNNQFDNKLYSQTLRYVFHMQPRVFEEQTRQNLILDKLYKQVTDSLTLTEEEIKNEYRKLNEEVSAYYIASTPSDFAKDVTPSEQEIKDYFNQNLLEFKEPLSFSLEYVRSEAEDKIKNMTLRLNKSRAFLAFKNISKYFSNKKVRDKEDDFVKIAQGLGLEVKETGFFRQTDSIPGIGWSPEISNLITKLKVGQSSHIYMDKYYCILRLKEKKEPYIPDFETIKDKAREAFIKKKSKEIAREKIENCLKELKETYQTNARIIDFNTLAKKYGVKSESSALFKYGSYIEGVGASDNFWLAAEKLKEDEFSNLIDAPSGYYIIRLKDRIPIDEKKFESEKTEFSKLLLLRRKQEHFTKFTEELKIKARMF